ncbi:MAG: hypothetical protein A3H36_06635 [Chloroflexi bacterium RIFCSPLOWO2_02_FULL_71_16]|nr:MAG: hypothetical protein A3H36_06635 [Chloroflexi bacterium RIFCSPLOWO2_02_FULL_71_16]
MTDQAGSQQESGLTGARPMSTMAAGEPPMADAAVATSPSFNRRRRGVLGGAVLVAVGVTYLLPTLGIPDATSYLFLALGGAFAAAYLTGFSPYVYLVPAAILISFGTGLLIPGWLGLPPDTVAPLFLASLTVGLAAVFVIRPQRRWPLVPAAIFGLVTLAEVFRIADVIPEGLQPLFVPLILIGVGGYLILAPRL